MSGARGGVIGLAPDLVGEDGVEVGPQALQQRKHARFEVRAVTRVVSRGRWQATRAPCGDEHLEARVIDGLFDAFANLTLDETQEIPGLPWTGSEGHGGSGERALDAAPERHRLDAEVLVKGRGLADVVFLEHQELVRRDWEAW